MPQEGRIETAAGVGTGVGEGVKRSPTLVEVAVGVAELAGVGESDSDDCRRVGVADGVGVDGTTTVAIMVMGSLAMRVGTIRACNPSNDDIKRAVTSVRMRPTTRTMFARKRGGSCPCSIKHRPGRREFHATSQPPRHLVQARR